MQSTYMPLSSKKLQTTYFLYLLAWFYAPFHKYISASGYICLARWALRVINIISQSFLLVGGLSVPTYISHSIDVVL